MPFGSVPTRIFGSTGSVADSATGAPAAGRLTVRGQWQDDGERGESEMQRAHHFLTGVGSLQCCK